MKNDFHGIIYTLNSDPALRDLVAQRNTASIPFGGRYRLIDFALSSMVNAGVRDVGVVMERDYQSLLDHLSNGKDWGLSRRHGGLRLLPPFGLREAHIGSFSGFLEALLSVRSYIEDIPHENVVLSSGDHVANFDLAAAMEQYERSGVEILAVCADRTPYFPHHRFIPDPDGSSRQMIFSHGGSGEGVASTEVYLMKKSVLLSIMDWCERRGKEHFHRDGLAHYIEEGGRIGLYMHEGYLRRICSAEGYYQASMDMLEPAVMSQFFPEERPIRTKERAEVSTYYSDQAKVRNCLVADGCYIEGELEDCVLFRGVKIAKGVKLKNCVILQDTVVGENADLRYVIADKDSVIRPNCFLVGSERLPIIVPKGETV